MYIYLNKYTLAGHLPLLKVGFYPSNKLLCAKEVIHNMTFLSLIIFSILLIGCSTSSEKVFLPSGEQGIAVRCEEFLKDCYKEAGKVCPNGYEVKEKTTASNFLVPVYDLLIVSK